MAVELRICRPLLIHPALSDYLRETMALPAMPEPQPGRHQPARLTRLFKEDFLRSQRQMTADHTSRTRALGTDSPDNVIAWANRHRWRGAADVLALIGCLDIGETARLNADP